MQETWGDALDGQISSNVQIFGASLHFRSFHFFSMRGSYIFGEITIISKGACLKRTVEESLS